MEKPCSAHTEKGCKHGHAVNAACLGIDTSRTVPVCCREDRVLDETRNVMTRRPWKGE